MEPGTDIGPSAVGAVRTSFEARRISSSSGGDPRRSHLQLQPVLRSRRSLWLNSLPSGPALAGVEQLYTSTPTRSSDYGLVPAEEGNGMEQNSEGSAEKRFRLELVMSVVG